MLIKEGDTDDIGHIINKVIECKDEGCYDKSSFLKGLLNKMRLFIDYYNSNIQENQADIEKYKEQLEALYQEQSDLQDIKDELASVYKLERDLMKY